jgi:predicted nucleotidyltransferase component of viral defense system
MVFDKLYNMALPDDHLSFLDSVKRIAIVAMFSDDRLMEELVLKGGAALDIAYNASTRASLDVDFSMGDEFEVLADFQARIANCLERTFQEHDLVIFDIHVTERPPGLTDDVRDFWGGYLVEFKIATRAVFATYENNIEMLRRHAKPVGTNNSTKFTIDISKHEFRGEKLATEIEGFTVFVYSPAMIVAEKIRAICQQSPDYGPIVKRGRAGTARARDFLDIYVGCEVLGVDFARPHFHEIVREMFLVKRVPLLMIGEIESQREFHRPDFASVQATVKSGFKLKSFDDYFDYVVEKCRALEVLWKVDPPM